MTAALLLWASLLSFQARPVPQAELALVGPLDRVELVTPDRGRTTVEVELPAGQRRRLRVPLSRSAELDSVSIEVEGAGTAELSRVELDRGPWSAALSRRARPPVQSPAARARGSELALLAALGLFVVAARRKPALALSLGGLGALALVLLPRSVESGRVAVLEGLAGESTWVLVERSSLHRGGVPFAPTDHLDVEPDRLTVDWTVLDGGPERAWVARGDLGSVTRFEAAESLDLSALRNSVLDLEVAWLREPGGHWSHRGAWTAGAPVPGARPGPDPPGWARLALPLGQPVLVGRRAAAGWPSWVRVVGAGPVDVPNNPTGSDGIPVED